MAKVHVTVNLTNCLSTRVRMHLMETTHCKSVPETKGQMTTCHTVTSPHLRCYITTLRPGASSYCWPTFVNTAVLMQSGASGVAGEGVWKGDDVHQMLRLRNYPPGATCCSPAVWDLCKERQSHTEAFVTVFIKCCHITEWINFIIAIAKILLLFNIEWMCNTTLWYCLPTKVQCI